MGYKKWLFLYEILRPGKNCFLMKSRRYGHSMTKINMNSGGLLLYFNDSWGGGGQV